MICFRDMTRLWGDLVKMASVRPESEQCALHGIGKLS
jgi:hypothetical protein